VEFLLFLGLLAFVSTALVFMLLATEDTRVRQGSIAEFEQHGAKTVQLFSRSIHNAERILSPSAGATGAILALQMRLENEYATVFAKSSTGNLIMVQKRTVDYVLPENVIMKNLVFRNVSGSVSKSMTFSFDLETIIPLPKPITYTKHFDGSALLPQDRTYESGGCSGCSAPACTSHDYKWPYCQSGVCKTGSGAISC
jgi:hypothetical protein